MNADKPWPVLVLVGDKSCAALMNRKAYRKSMESGEPWIVHPGTGRVLPWPECPGFRRLIEAPGHFRLELPEDAVLHPYGDERPPDTDPDDHSRLAPSSAGAMPLQSLPSAETDVLAGLYTRITERRAAMPSGSYTTHLFESGPAKIRKKLGEEAVELILAEEPADVVYEAADLIYHLQVLLNALGVEWSGVIGELARRGDE